MLLQWPNYLNGCGHFVTRPFCQAILSPDHWRLDGILFASSGKKFGSKIGNEIPQIQRRPIYVAYKRKQRRAWSNMFRLEILLTLTLIVKTGTRFTIIYSILQSDLIFIKLLSYKVKYSGNELAFVVYIAKCLSRHLSSSKICINK